MRVVAVVGLACASACSLFTSLDGVSGGAADAPDAEPPGDAATGSDARGDDARADAATNDDDSGDAGFDAGPNYQPNGGFELFTGGSQCGAEWGVFQGTGTRVTDAHDGMYACEACGTSTSSSNYSLNDNDSPMLTVAPGERYVASVWVRAANGDPQGQTVKASIRIYQSATVVQRVDPAAVTLTTSWTRVDTIIDVTTAGQFNYYVQFYDGPSGACALLDDVTIYRVY